MKLRCPNCHFSDDIIEWVDGYLCRECGTEFDGPRLSDDDEADEDDDDETDLEELRLP